MKLGFTWMTVAIGCLFVGGWGSSFSTQAKERAITTTSGPREQRSSPRTAACSSERLRWLYDARSRVLRLDDSRVQLNCCGQRTLSVERVDSILEVTQRDEPSAGGRCDSQCEYDLSVVVTQTSSADETFIRLLRDVTDEGGGPILLWQGNLDLTQGSGLIALDSSDPCSDAL